MWEMEKVLRCKKAVEGGVDGGEKDWWMENGQKLGENQVSRGG